MTNQETKHIAK